MNFWQLKTLRFCIFSKISISKNFRELNENVFFRKFRFQQCLDSSPKSGTHSRSRHKFLEIKNTENFYVFKNFASNTVLEYSSQDFNPSRFHHKFLAIKDNKILYFFRNLSFQAVFETSLDS
jgi:hypothetical protein